MWLQPLVAQKSQSPTHCIVKCRAYLTDELTGAIGPRSICEERDGDARIQVNPKRAAAIPEMADGVLREEGSG